MGTRNHWSTSNERKIEFNSGSERIDDRTYVVPFSRPKKRDILFSVR